MNGNNNILHQHYRTATASDIVILSSSSPSSHQNHVAKIRPQRSSSSSSNNNNNNNNNINNSMKSWSKGMIFISLLWMAVGMTISMAIQSMMVLKPNTAAIHGDNRQQAFGFDVHDVDSIRHSMKVMIINNATTATTTIATPAFSIDRRIPDTASSSIITSSTIASLSSHNPSNQYDNNHQNHHHHPHHQQQHPSTIKYNGSIESLLELTQSLPHSTLQTHHSTAASAAACPKPLVWVHDTLLSNPQLAYHNHRKIPRIVHITSASRCNHEIIAKSLNSWRLNGHYFILHDDAAVLRLLYEEDWSWEFPLLTQILQCLPRHMGAVWIDVWRLLVLYKFGGIYADFDTAPVPGMFHADTTITPEDDAFFVQEIQGSPSQWFMAASPKHPMMYLSVLHATVNVLKERNLGNFQVVFSTGPGAVAEAFASFMNSDKYLWNAPAGHYVGIANRSVTIVGDLKHENMYITRVIKPMKSNKAKQRMYALANMTHLTKAQGTVYQPTSSSSGSTSSMTTNTNRARKKRRNKQQHQAEVIQESCMSRLYNLATKQNRR